jgi:hypothetical protein
MSTRAATYIGLTIAVGAIFLGDSFSRDRKFDNLAAFASYFALAIFTSSWKVRLPGITGTISVNFLFILIAIAVFSFSETVIMAGTACVVQCLWKPRRQPRVIQVLFNIATLAISSGTAYRAAHAIAGRYEAALPVLLALAACFYFTCNTLMISGVLSLVEGKGLIAVWKQCYLWSFPYYLAGAVVAAIIVYCGRAAGWAMPLGILPLMWMIHLFYRNCVQRLA